MKSRTSSARDGPGPALRAVRHLVLATCLSCTQAISIRAAHRRFIPVDVVQGAQALVPSGLSVGNWNPADDIARTVSDRGGFEAVLPLDDKVVDIYKRRPHVPYPRHRQIIDVECLERIHKQPGYKCKDSQYVQGPAPAAAPRLPTFSGAAKSSFSYTLSKAEYEDEHLSSEKLIKAVADAGYGSFDELDPAKFRTIDGRGSVYDGLGSMPKKLEDDQFPVTVYYGPSTPQGMAPVAVVAAPAPAAVASPAAVPPPMRPAAKAGPVAANAAPPPPVQRAAPPPKEELPPQPQPRPAVDAPGFEEPPVRTVRHDGAARARPLSREGEQPKHGIRERIRRAADAPPLPQPAAAPQRPAPQASSGAAESAAPGNEDASADKLAAQDGQGGQGGQDGADAEEPADLEAPADSEAASKLDAREGGKSDSSADDADEQPANTDELDKSQQTPKEEGNNELERSIARTVNHITEDMAKVREQATIPIKHVVDGVADAVNSISEAVQNPFVSQSESEAEADQNSDSGSEGATAVVPMGKAERRVSEKESTESDPEQREASLERDQQELEEEQEPASAQKQDIHESDAMDQERLRRIQEKKDKHAEREERAKRMRERLRALSAMD